jgi:hypothetical protein
LLLGYFEFIGFLFLPGVAFIELFRLGGDFSFADRLGLAFGLSMAIDVLFLGFRTSGIVIGGITMLKISPLSLDLLLLASVAVLGLAVAIRRRSHFYSRPTVRDLLILAIVIAQSVIVLAHFTKYPIFPEYQSVDFEQHVIITNSILSGAALMPGGVLYYGIHLLMASAVVLSGDMTLVVTQYTLGIITALSPLLVYLAVDSLLGSERTSLIASGLYVAAGFVWYGSVFDAGLFPNFYGLLSILLVVSLLVAVTRMPANAGVWIAFVGSVANGYLSHYSFLTIVPAIIALPIITLVFTKKANRVHILAAVVVVLPAALAFILDPNLVGILQFLQPQSSGSITGDTFVSQYLLSAPLLRYVFIEITNDPASLLTLALAAIGIYVVATRRQPFPLLLLIWAASLVLISPEADSAWRFSYMLLMPLLLLAAIGIEILLPRAPGLVRRSKMHTKRNANRPRYVLLVLITLTLVVNSWSWNLLVDSASNNAATNETQHGVLASMMWMNDNLPPGSRIVSVTDFSYAYFQILFGRIAGYAPLAPPDEIVAATNGSSVPTYVVLTKLGTFSSLLSPSQNPFNEYPSDQRFRLLYNETGVLVYKLGQ